MIKKTIIYAFIACMPSLLFGQTRTSVNGGGPYTTASTWDCNCVPATTESVIINNGHTVTLTANRTVNNVEIRNGAILSNSRTLEITGNYIVNGSHTGSGDIRLSGINSTIDGIGIISNSGDLDIRDGNKTILSTADLSKTTGGSARIRGAITVTNQGTFRTDRNIRGDNTSIWTNGNNSVLEAGRALLNRGTLNAFASGNVVIYSQNGNQNIKTPSSLNYYNLTLTGTNNKAIGSNLNILGDLSIEGGTFLLGTRTVSLSGDFLNSGGLIDEGTSTFIFNGLSNQNLQALTEESFYNFQVNKSGSNLILDVDIVVANAFTLSGGNIETNNFKVLLGTSAASIGSLTRSNGYIQGNFARWLNATGTTYLYPIGSSSSYHPANISFANLTSGILEFSFIDNAPGSQGLPIDDVTDSVRHAFTEGYWISSATSGLVSTNFNLNLDATGFTSYSINSSTRLMRRSSSVSNWQVEGSHVPAANPIVSRNNMISISSQYGIGDTTGCLLPSPTTSAISGSVSECINTSAGYNVLNTSGSSYIWEITGGVQSPAGTSNSITVNWGSVGMTGEVKVTEYNGCEYGNPVTLAVDINPLPPITISGSQNVEQFTTGIAYSTPSVIGYTYNWTITGGTQASGGNTANITVNWGAKGVGHVSVTATNGCGTSTPHDHFINIFEYVRSITLNGDWDQTTTWDCTCIPDETNNVIIQPTHNITLTGNEKTGNIIINPTGSLIMGRRLDVFGLLINNGSVTGSGKLTKFGSYPFEGNGSWSGHTGLVSFDAGVHTIEANVNMEKTTGDVDVRANTTVINYGHIETTGNLTGGNATSAVWYNDTASILSVGLNLLSNGKLVANAEHNTVIYSRTGANNQNLKQPDANQYYNLIIDGDNLGSDKSVTSDLEILGDLTIAASTLNGNGSFNISLHGNWNNTGGVFNPVTTSVILVGTNQTISHTSEEVFYNLKASTSGTKLLNTPIVVANDLTIDNGTILDVNNAQNNQLNVQGNIINNGTLKLQKAMLLLDGGTAQSINGSFNMYDVIGTNSAGISMVSGALTLENSMQLTGATTFNTNNNLTFLSTAAQTAYIKELAAGNSVTGNVTVQRYLNEGVGWYMLGAPVTGSTLADWNNEITMSGFTGSNNPGAGLSVYSYSESARNGSGYTSGYQGATNTTNPLNPGEGWFVYLFSDPITTDVTGPLQQGTIATGTLSHTAIGATAERGWHLVANPYASPILWSDVTKANIQANEAYVRRADIGGNYWAVNGDNIDTIYSGEGFWTQMAVGGGSLTFDEADKIDAIDDYNAKQVNAVSTSFPLIMELTYSSNINYFDYSVLQFGDSMNTSSFDGTYGESRKIGSSVGTYPNIGSYALADSSVVYYNSLNPSESVSIPLKIWTQYPSNRMENYSLDFKGIEEWNNYNHCLILTDSSANITKKLEHGNSGYQWSMLDNMSDPILFLNHTSPISTEFSNTTCYGSKNGKAKVLGSGSGSHDYTWTNSTGDTLLKQKNHSGWSELKDLSAGNYFVAVTDNGVCTDMATEVIIEDGAPIISSYSYQVSASKPGEIIFTNTSIDAVKYLWDFGDGHSSIAKSPTHTYVNNDMYEVSLIAYREACTDTSQQMIEISDLFLNISEKEQVENISVYLSGKQIIIEADFIQPTPLAVSVQNTMGQTINEYSFSGSKIFRKSIPSPPTKGVYLISIRSDSLSETQKILVK